MSTELDDINDPFLSVDGSSSNAPVVEDLDFEHLASLPVTDSYTVSFKGHDIFVDSTDWRNSTLLKYQILACYCNFILFGLAEQTIGTIIPILEEYYNIDDFHTGIVFLASTSGYFVMALVTEKFHRTVGVRGVGIFGAGSMTFAYLIIYQKPPFPVFVFAYFFSGIGFGSLDASFNGWMGDLIDSNQLLGILHGCYGIGCMISPPLITRLLHRKDDPWQWNDYYLVLSCLTSSCLLCFSYVFRYETAMKYEFNVLLKEARKIFELKQQEHENASFTSEEGSPASVPGANRSSESTDSVPLSVALRSKLVWFFSLIMFIYVGAEAAFGTWLVTFLTRIKSLSYHRASYMATTFWTGLTLGRIFLGFATVHFFESELNANWFYILMSLIGHIIFGLAVFTPVNVILYPIVLFSGLFVGPIFPTTIVTSIRILPVKFHATGVGFICAFGGGGAAAIPFLIGLVAETSKFGLRFYPYIVIALYAFLLVAWSALKATKGRGLNSSVRV